MLGGTADRRLMLLAEGLRTAASLARSQAAPGIIDGTTVDHDELVGARRLAKFADDLDATAIRFEDLADGLIAVHS